MLIPSPALRTWHKKAYKMLAGLVVVEHCVFFLSIPITLFHALGMSLSDCLAHYECTGIRYSAWTTVSGSNTERVQRMQSKDLSVHLGSDRVGLFISFLVFLGLGVLLLGGYVYGEVVRKKAPVSGKTRPSISLFQNRKLLLKLMACVSLAQFVCSVVGLSLLSSWLVAPTLMALATAQPLYNLNASLTREATITRFQLRKIFQICLALLFFWLYCAGGGAAMSVISALNVSIDGSASWSYRGAVTQILVLLALHLIFSVSSGIGVYVHLSITDVIESLFQTKKRDIDILEKGEAVQTRPHECVDVPCGAVPEPATVQATITNEPTMEWGAKQCASCCTNQPDIVLVPCGHSVICGDCSKVLLTITGFRCPLCCAQVHDASRF